MSENISPFTRLEIVQAASNSVTDAKAKFGKLRDTVSGKQFATMDVTLLFIQTYRVFFGSAVIGATPACQSLNGIVPAKFIQMPVHTNCSTCTKSQWLGGNRPDCKEKRILYMIDNKTHTPYDIVLPGSSVSQTDALKKRIELQILRSKLQGKTHHMWDFKVTLALVAGKKGPKYQEIDYRNLLQRKDAGQNPAIAEFAQLALPAAA